MNAQNHLKNYKYSATDNSICSRLFLNRYYNFIVEFVPLWVAPNVLTLIGLILSLTSLTITLITDATLCNQKYPIIKLINAFLLFTYQSFDAIDGKQARRTNSSSPLGQLFDHGCDALVCFSTAITVSSSLGLGLNSYFTLFLFALISIYYLCSLEEYATGHFYLGYISGPTEGILAGVIAHICSYFFGSECFSFLKTQITVSLFTTEPISIPIFHIAISTFILLSVFVTILNIHKSKTTISKLGLFGSFMNMHTLFMCYIIYTNVLIVKQSALTNYIVLLNFVFLFARNTLDLGFAHLTKQNIVHPEFNFYIFVYTSVLALYIRLNLFIYVLMAISAGYSYFDRAYRIINEVCHALKINCFSLAK
ncbi:hypothetical protein COBT_002494, partial [Conglomerata obtusa]